MAQELFIKCVINYFQHDELLRLLLARVKPGACHLLFTLTDCTHILASHKDELAYLLSLKNETYM